MHMRERDARTQTQVARDECGAYGIRMRCQWTAKREELGRSRTLKSPERQQHVADLAQRFNALRCPSLEFLRAMRATVQGAKYEDRKWEPVRAEKATVVSARLPDLAKKLHAAWKSGNADRLALAQNGAIASLATARILEKTGDRLHVSVPRRRKTLCKQYREGPYSPLGRALSDEKIVDRTKVRREAIRKLEQSAEVWKRKTREISAKELHCLLGYKSNPSSATSWTCGILVNDMWALRRIVAEGADKAATAAEYARSILPLAPHEMEQVALMGGSKSGDGVNFLGIVSDDEARRFGAAVNATSQLREALGGSLPKSSMHHVLCWLRQYTKRCGDEALIKREANAKSLITKAFRRERKEHCKAIASWCIKVWEEG
jgi:hypothetical protein